MKIYTGTGDKGKTSLFSGERIPKNNPRVAAYGDLDELNAIIGALIAVFPVEETELIEELYTIQAHLLQAGAWLATSPDSPAIQDLDEFTPAHVLHMEHLIDTLESDLDPLSGFILPGGHISAAWAHIARTVCRRVERKIVGLIQGDSKGTPVQIEHIIMYINRLSDFLFVLARHCNKIYGSPDIIWRK